MNTNQPSPEVLAACYRYTGTWEPNKICLMCADYYEQHDALQGNWWHDIPMPPASAELEVALIRKLNAERLSVSYMCEAGVMIGWHKGEGPTIYDAVADMLKRREK